MRKTLVAIVLLAAILVIGCEPGLPSAEQAQSEKRTETVASLMSKQPGPVVDYSMDRYLLSERLVRFNDPNKMSYLYVCMSDGTWLQVTIIGKLSSTSKRLTAPEQYYYGYSNSNFGGLGSAPDEMGTYGTSDPAHVGMTTAGSLLEIGGFLSYIYSEVPLSFGNKAITNITVEASAAEREALMQKLGKLQGR